jgi:hypothetical protein
VLVGIECSPSLRRRFVGPARFWDPRSYSI